MHIGQYLLSFLYPQTLETANSKINGVIKVQKYFGHDRIIVGNLTQSGEYVADLMKKGVRLAKLQPLRPAKILLLGLGGGSLVAEINHLLPQATIIGVEIDPEMVRLGKKYLHLDRMKNLSIVVEDALEYCQKSPKRGFDLIILDCYLGREIPAKLQMKEFLTLLRELLMPHGVLICNRLNFGHHKVQTAEFTHRLETIFPKIVTKRVFSNLIVMASTV